MCVCVCAYNGGRQIAVCFDERNHFRSTFVGRDHEDIFGITKDRVIKQDAEKHQSKGKQLLPFILRGDNGFQLKNNATRNGL